jgi:hypothetical protein
MELGEINRRNGAPAAGKRQAQSLRGHFFTGK